MDGACTYFRQLVRFFSVDYFLLLIHYGIDTVFGGGSAPGTGRDRDRDSLCSVASDWSVSEGHGGVSTSLQNEMTTWAECEVAMDALPADEILTLSEQTVNAVFAGLWKKDTEERHGGIAQWVHAAGSFQASFAAFKVRLLSNGTAMVWVNVDEGETAVVRWVCCLVPAYMRI